MLSFKTLNSAGDNICKLTTFTALVKTVNSLRSRLNYKQASVFLLFQEQTHLRFLMYSIRGVISLTAAIKVTSGRAGGLCMF